ncbi:MAG: FHA domain-containing protein, partial [Nitrospira sp.]|nr:FHA domain-containing protein [Nitrospira sp.]
MRDAPARIPHRVATGVADSHGASFRASSSWVSPLGPFSARRCSVASLQVIKGPHVGAVFELTTSESVMGRYPFCDVVLPSHTISRQHARVVQAGDQF